MMLKKWIVCGLMLCSAWTMAAEMATIKAGSYRPLYLNKNTPKISVATFKLDKLPVSNADFYRFVQQQSQWQKGRINKKYSDANYLKHWVKDGKVYRPKPEDADKPVTNVSWFAADAYCRAQGKHLPTINQWEYAGQASALRPNGATEKAYRDVILKWYAEGSRRGLTKVGQSRPNYWGVYDMHGLIWEWTEDFNSSLLNSGSVDSSMFCGGGAANAADPSDYAAFMRYGFRTSLQAKFAIHNLGFRCAI